MKLKRILICDGTVDGIFTAIYRAYDMRYGHEFIQLAEADTGEGGMNYELFAEYIKVETDYELSAKVGKSVRQKISGDAYETCVRAALSDVVGRSDTIYRFMILGFHMGKDVMSHLSNDVVIRMFAMNRQVGNEAHHMTGFLRFQEVGDGILLSIIKPRNHIISLLAPHFADRLNNENFIIYDEGRKVAAIHSRNTEPVLIAMDQEMIRALDQTKTKQKEYEMLWKTFYESISIKERENWNLQRNNLPLRFRSNMTEFQK